MTEVSLERIVPERQFAGLLQTSAEPYLRLSNTLLAERDTRWNKRHFFQLVSEADTLESFLDDYGARFNRTYAPLTALVASVRWFAHAGYSIAHLLGRLHSYGEIEVLSGEDAKGAQDSIQRASDFIQSTAVRLLEAILDEVRELGLEVPPDGFSESGFLPVVSRRQLPRNVGQADPENEEQKIVEVASRYLQACELLAGLGIRPIADPSDRADFLVKWCREEQARVYEATVHNLQSAYDTYIRNTVLEGQDARLVQLRGHCSAALHLLEAVTHLTHFIERHEDEFRAALGPRRVSILVDRNQVRDVILNHLLLWANRFLQRGCSAATELLPSYANVQTLDVTLPDDVSLHARPVALIVAIVNQYGLPVEMEVGGEVAGAGSILKLLMTVGSHPHERHFVFRGDERPLRDIGLLFEHGLGERGMDTLPPQLAYLRN